VSTVAPQAGLKSTEAAGPILWRSPEGAGLVVEAEVEVEAGHTRIRTVVAAQAAVETAEAGHRIRMTAASPLPFRPK